MLNPLLIALLTATWGCSGDEAADEEPEVDGIPNVPVPAADGPKLYIIDDLVVVRDRPAFRGKPLGTLRAGAAIARAAEPYSRRGCEGGWYPIRPSGFVCAGPKATTDEGELQSRALSTPAAMDQPLPYRYARVRRGGAVAYGTLPTREQQVEAEPELGSHAGPEPKRLGAASNDVPLTPDGFPAGVPVVAPDGDGVGADGYRDTESFFQFPGTERLEEGTALLVNSQAAGENRVLRRGSGVPIVGSFTAGGSEDGRRFGITPAGRFVPIDRLKPALGTTWHGVDLREAGLPLSFALRSVRSYEMDGATARNGDTHFEQGEAILLDGKFRTVRGVRYYFTRDEQWVRHKDLILINKRHKFPDWATADQKWLDISLGNQTLVAWEGHKPVYATLISSGKDRLGEPETGPSTMRGVFRLRSKFVTRGIDDREVGQKFTVLEVPWVAEFEEGFALTASYWTRRFGEAQGYHNVALPPVDAHLIWQWMDPLVPHGWHSVFIDPQSAGSNTIIYVHK